LPLPDSIPLGVLRQTHPDYAVRLWTELQDFYVGGYQLLAKSRNYAGPQAGEQSDRYGDRCGAIGYINYLGEIIDYYVAALFSQELELTEASDADNPTTVGGKSDTDFYSSFSADADLAGNSFAAVMRDAFRDAVLLKRSLICCDFPTPEETPTSLAAEDALGANRAYIYQMPLEHLINWELDRFGAYKFAVIYQTGADQKSVLDVRGGMVHHSFKVWSLADNGTAVWDTYEIDEDPARPLEDKVAVPRTGGGPTSFAQIPILRVEMRDGLWIGNKVGPLAKEHFIRRSILVEAENKSMMAVPWIKRGPEMSAIGEALPSATQQDPSRGSHPVRRFQNQGWVALGADDDIGFAEPEGKAYAHVARELDALKDEMHRVVHQMAASVSNKAGSVARSGDSKKQDRAAESVVLGQFGKDVRDFAKRIYAMVAQARGEDVVWVARGLDRFDHDDREVLIKEAVQVDMVSIPSSTFKKEYKVRLANALAPNLAAATQDVIRTEIQDGVDEAEKHAEEMKKQMLLTGVDPAKPAPFGQKPGMPVPASDEEADDDAEDDPKKPKKRK